MAAQVTIDLKEFMSLKETAEKVKTSKTLLSEIDSKGNQFLISTDDVAVAEMMSGYEICRQRNICLENDVKTLSKSNYEQCSEREKEKEIRIDLKRQIIILTNKLDTLKTKIDEIFA